MSPPGEVRAEEDRSLSTHEHRDLLDPQTKSASTNCFVTRSNSRRTMASEPPGDSEIHVRVTEPVGLFSSYSRHDALPL